MQLVLGLIIFIIFGAIIAYLAQHNLALVSLTVGPYIFKNIPLFYVIIGSVLTGLIVSYVIYLVHTIALKIKIHGKDKKIIESTNEMADLTKRIHQLELENVKLKKVTDTEPLDTNAL